MRASSKARSEYQPIKMYISDSTVVIPCNNGRYVVIHERSDGVGVYKFQEVGFRAELVRVLDSWRDAEVLAEQLAHGLGPVPPRFAAVEDEDGHDRISMSIAEWFERSRCSRRDERVRNARSRPA